MWIQRSTIRSRTASASATYGSHSLSTWPGSSASVYSRWATTPLLIAAAFMPRKSYGKGSGAARWARSGWTDWVVSAGRSGSLMLSGSALGPKARHRRARDEGRYRPIRAGPRRSGEAWRRGPGCRCVPGSACDNRRPPDQGGPRREARSARLHAAQVDLVGARGSRTRGAHVDSRCARTTVADGRRRRPARGPRSSRRRRGMAAPANVAAPTKPGPVVCQSATAGRLPGLRGRGAASCVARHGGAKLSNARRWDGSVTGTLRCAPGPPESLQ